MKSWKRMLGVVLGGVLVLAVQSRADFECGYGGGGGAAAGDPGRQTRDVEYILETGGSAALRNRSITGSEG